MKTLIKKYNILVLCFSITLLISCGTEKNIVKLIPDNKWHPVYAVQADKTVLLKIKKSHTGKKLSKDATKPFTQIRLVRITPYQDLSSLPDTIPKGSVADTELQRTSDFGPEDISQDGSVKKIQLTPGIQLLSRTNQPNSILIIKKEKNHGK